MSPISFVVGNGLSRSSINIPQLKLYGTVYGCNALYRDVAPHHLIAVDKKMIIEIVNSGYHKNHSVWTNPNKSYENIKELNFFNPSRGWSSGPTALRMASEKEPKEIYILGFDFKGAGSDRSKFNNIYADTHNYKQSNETATFHGNWVRQTVDTIKYYSTIKYYRVIQSDNFCPSELNKCVNLSNITIEKFQKKFNFQPAL